MYKSISLNGNFISLYKNGTGRIAKNLVKQLSTSKVDIKINKEKQEIKIIPGDDYKVDNNCRFTCRPLYKIVDKERNIKSTLRLNAEYKPDDGAIIAEY